MSPELETEVIGAIAPGRPTLVFLHEGLGSLSLWRDFPRRCAEATGMAAVVYSRAGYGRSPSVELPRPLDYMQREARTVLPELLLSLAIDRPLLFGHSDGATIAIDYAAGTEEPRPVALVLEAPHVFVEERSTRSIAAAVQAYEQGDLRSRLERHHGGNVDCAFYGWARAWLDPGFPAAFDLRSELGGVAAPVLLIQEQGDPYGTVAQLDALAAGVRGPVKRLWLPGEGHSPHREHPAEVIAALVGLASSVSRAGRR